MSFNQKKYSLLRRNSLENESDDQPTQNPGILADPSSATTILSIIIAVLLCTNGFLVVHAFREKKSGHCDGRSYFAGLERTTPSQILHSTEFSSENGTEVARLWEELSGDPGVVALPHDFVAENGLPEAMPFPWDTNKGVYLLQGFHNLHCLRAVHRYVWNADQNLPQTIALSHIQHCLDQLRQDVICNADDTPRYAGFQDPPGTGAGQVRMCRDWGKLEQWAIENTACFKHEDGVFGPMRDKFKYCPDGRVLWPASESPE